MKLFKNMLPSAVIFAALSLPSFGGFSVASGGGGSGYYQQWTVEVPSTCSIFVWAEAVITGSITIPDYGIYTTTWWPNGPGAQSWWGSPWGGTPQNPMQVSAEAQTGISGPPSGFIVAANVNTVGSSEIDEHNVFNYPAGEYTTWQAGGVSDPGYGVVQMYTEIDW